MYCGECGKHCDQVEFDFGIGPYEFWGRRGVDTNQQWVSDCCEAKVFEDEDLRVEEDEPDLEADRADYLNDMRREESW